MSFGAKTTGLDALAARSTRMLQGTRPMVREVLWKLGGDVLERARPLVPVDTGHLRSTGHVGRVEASGDVQSVTVGFFAPYAEIQEEREDFEHRVGQAHYLRDATHEVAGNRRPLIKAALGRLVKGG